MGEDGPERRLTVVDASVLINFLGLGRFVLLTGLRRDLVITAEANGQIRRKRAPLDAALSTGEIRVKNPLLEEDAELFGQLSRMLGVADASCIVAARALGADLAADDRTFLREAEKVLSSEQTLLGTETLLAEAVHTGALDIEEGNELLGELAGPRYRTKVRSLRELL